MKRPHASFGQFVRTRRAVTAKFLADPGESARLRSPGLPDRPASRALENTLLGCCFIDPGRGARAGDPGDLGDPILLEELVRVAVPGSQRAHVLVIQSGQAAIADDRILRPVPGRDHERGEEEMDVEMAIEEPALGGPLFLRPAPTGLSIPEPGPPAPPLLPNRLPGLSIDQQMELERVGGGAAQEML